MKKIVYIDFVFILFVALKFKKKIKEKREKKQ